MPSDSRTAEREEERRLNMRTLVIASSASAAAALLTSQLWIAGTWIAAAMTPVIVALVSEMLHRPTAKLTERFTAETDALPEAAGAGPPPRSEARRPEPPARDMTIYTSPKRRLPWRTILLTGGLAFVIGAAVLTLPELIAGQSLGKGDGAVSIAPINKDRDRNRDDEEQPAEEQPAVTETVPAEEPPETVTETTPAPPTRTTPQQTTPTTPAAPAP
jgi:hypothetical protein